MLAVPTVTTTAITMGASMTPRATTPPQMAATVMAMEAMVGMEGMEAMADTGTRLRHMGAIRAKGI